MAELLLYLEDRQQPIQAISKDFLRTAALLLAKLSELLYPFDLERIDQLAEYLKRLNHTRPQSARWSELDWRRLARAVLENRKLKTALYFSPNPPLAWDMERELEIPHFARLVGEPPDWSRVRAPATPADELVEEATSLMQTVSADLTDASTLLKHLKRLGAKFPPQPPTE